MKKKKKTWNDTVDQVSEAPSVYVFHNTLFNFNMFISAHDAEEAMEKFDQCCMKHREQWKVMVEIGLQPSEGSHGK